MPVTESAFARLDFLFHPRSIAVVGASTDPRGPGGFVASIRNVGFTGALYPVNPKAQEIMGYRCYASLADVPGGVDYVISSIPARLVPEMVEQAATKGVRVIHFFTAGFSETGDEERIELESRVLARCRELGIRVIGPNCMGLYVPSGGLSFMPEFPPEPGPVSLISQSGANAGEFVRTGTVRGLRFAKVISYGNAGDLDESDFLEYCAEDPETSIIAAYIEGVRDGQRFLRALRKAATAKPVLVLKGGRTEAGGRAARSHTGSLAGSAQVFSTACRQAGAVTVGGIEELADVTVAFRFLGRLPGPRAGIVGIGGGRSVLAADDAAAAGLEVPPLPEATQHRLLEFTPMAGTSVRNPVDTTVGWGRDPEQLVRTLQIVAEAENIDFLIFHTSFGFGANVRGVADPVELARTAALRLAEGAADIGKPLLLVPRIPVTVAGMEATLAFVTEAGSHGLATFFRFEDAVNAAATMLRWQAMHDPVEGHAS